ncbi:hypothetical protein ONZ45_g10879 [Pleurotus djamor]|nr:hypothetical protein ONZ45_g10879 [Pleurotus djamor]
MARTKQTAAKSVNGTAPRKAPSTTSLATTVTRAQKTSAATTKRNALQRPYHLVAPDEKGKDSPREDRRFIEDTSANGCLQITCEAKAKKYDFICPAATATKMQPSSMAFSDNGQPILDLLVAVKRATSVFFAPIKTPTTVLFFLALEGCQSMDQPMIDAHSYLEPYFGRDQGQLLTFSVFFNFQRGGAARYRSQLNDVIAAISDDATTQVIVLFMTHVGEDDCLQHAPVVRNNKGGVTDHGASFDPKQVLTDLFVEDLMIPMKQKQRSSLFFFVCKGIEGHTETRDWMSACVARRCFEEIFSFTALSFQPCLARSFVGNYLVQSSSMSEIRNPHSFYCNEDVSAFLLEAMKSGQANSDMPVHWRGLNLDILASILAEAWDNRVILPVTAHVLINASNERITRLLARVDLGEITRPLILLSLDNIPLVVYLPSLLSFMKQVSLAMAQSVSLIESILAKPLTNSRDDPPKPSVSLRKKTNVDSATSWLKHVKDFFTLGDVLLALFHPESYEHGRRAIASMKTSDDPSLAYWARRWPSAFSCLSVLANRRSPLHLDSKGDCQQYDFLVNTGTARTVIRLGQVGAIFQYLPGAGIMFSGGVFEHDSPGWFEGERVGFVLHMRPEVVRVYNDSDLERFHSMNDAATPFKRFANLRQFLDLEAQVDASEDSEEDSILEDDFLDDHDDGRGSPSSLTRTDRFDVLTEHEANQDAANC